MHSFEQSMERVLANRIRSFSTGILFFLLTLSIVTISGTIFYHSTVEWNNGPAEDATLQGVNRVLRGLPLYSDSSPEYVPGIYGPGFFYLSAILARIFGLSFFSVRLVSLISLAFIPLLLFFLARIRCARSESWGITIAGTALILSLYAPTGYWMDLAKVDSLFIIMILTNLYLLTKLFDRNNRIHLLLLILASSSLFFIKQTGLLIVLSNAILIFLFISFSSALIYSVGVAIVMSTLALLFEMQSGNHFIYYTVLLPMHHPLSEKGASGKMIAVIGPLMLVTAVYLIEFLYSNWRKIIYLRKVSLPWKDTSIKHEIVIVAYLIVTFFISLVGRMKAGAVDNSFLYTGVMMGIYVAIHLSQNIRQTGTGNNSYPGGKSLPFLLLAIVLVQIFFIGYFNPLKRIHNDLDRKAMLTRHVHNLCSLPDPSLFFNLSYLPQYYCNRKDNFTYMYALDIIYSDRKLTPFVHEMQHKINNQDYKSIIATNLTYFDQPTLELMLGKVNARLAEDLSEKDRERTLLFKSALELNYSIATNYRKIPEESAPLFKDYLETEKVMYPGSNLYILKPRVGQKTSDFVKKE